MASADFCAAIGSPHGSPSPESRTRHRPPRLSLTTFTAHPPDLQPKPFDGWRTLLCSDNSSHLACLLSDSCASSRGFAPRFLQTRLTTTPLRFANPSPPSSWIRDLHPQVENMPGKQKKDSGPFALSPNAAKSSSIFRSAEKSSPRHTANATLCLWTS